MRVWQRGTTHRLGLDRWVLRLGGGLPLLIGREGVWDRFTTDKTFEGPAFYSHPLNIPEDWLNKRIIFHAGAISFHATVRVNGQAAGQHAGMWSPFQVELTPFLHTGDNELEIEVWKPGRRFPLRETLAGFLPDVATTFGGIWQMCWVGAYEHAALSDIQIHTRAKGEVRVRGCFENWSGLQANEVAVRIWSRHDRLAQAVLKPDSSLNSFAAQLNVDNPVLWKAGSENEPYSLEIILSARGQPLASFGQTIHFRDVDSLNGRTRLNGQPIHFRGVLDWGWPWLVGPGGVSPASAHEFSSQVEKARQLGFNLFKFCLCVPGEQVFREADVIGALIWLEMPMWLPHVTPELKELALREYRDVFSHLHHHPSIAIVSLGCELNAEADAGFLRELHALAREWFPNALICDNSGSAEAYGGVATDLSDFYDYHFYTDPHFFPALVQHFQRAYRPDKPWIYGEFCDADTLRDFSLLETSDELRYYIQTPDGHPLSPGEAHEYSRSFGVEVAVNPDDGLGWAKAPPVWWLSDMLPLDREQLRTTRNYRQLLSAAGVADNGAELTRIARQQATAVRRFILEHVRAQSATGGYVVTGWIDTPITTSGMVDDNGHLKFPPDEWRPFNADVVLTIDRERRRRWVGGDQPNLKDPHTWWQGERAEIHLLLSNGGKSIFSGQVEWQLVDASGAEVARGAHEIGSLPGGEVQEVAVIAAGFPQSPEGRPLELTLTARIVNANSVGLERVDDEALVSSVRTTPYAPPGPPVFAANAWKLWAVPRPRLRSFAAAGGFARHHHFTRIDRNARVIPWTGDKAIVVTDTLDDALLDFVRAGGRALLWLTQPDDRFTRVLSFWREAIHLFPPHRLWERVPHAGYADMRFFSLATEFAFGLPQLTSLTGGAAVFVWRRFDARAMTWADYLAELRLGTGLLLVTTLRLEGGLGAQPAAFEQHPWGAWLFASLLETLHTTPA